MNKKERRRRARQRMRGDAPGAAVTVTPVTGAAVTGVGMNVDMRPNLSAMSWRMMRGDAHARFAVYAMGAVFAAFAYLACVHLGWALFWDDEATVAYLARNWLEFGAPLVDDGRNVYTYHHGRDITADGGFRYPKLITALQAASFAVFGEGEAQARMVSALLSLAGMALFADILRREFPRRHGFIAVAFALACLSPVTLGFARAATYNSAVLFFHMLAVWSYLCFCERKHAGYAALMCAAAIGGFHAHYLSGLVFACAFAAMHLLFRARGFGRRHWLLISLAGAAYAAQVMWQFFFAYDAESYALRAVDWSMRNLERTFRWNIKMLSRQNVLAWSIALWALVWCVARIAWPRGLTSRREALRELRDDRVLHYLAMVFIGVCALSFIGLNVGLGEVRYFSAFAPFAALPAAAAVCWAWRWFRPGGAAVGALLLLTNAAGWPLLNSWQHADKPGWTLPLLAAGYHRDYHDALRGALEHLRENAAQDDVVYVDHPNPSWMFWYFSDRLLLCCRFASPAQVPGVVDARARGYLLEENVRRGMPDPDWLLFHLPRPLQEEIEFRSGGPRYRRVGNFPDAWHPSAQRPEPQSHIAFPAHGARFGPATRPPYRMRLYRIVRAE
ncbi:MAG: glycosyltransferase family 39 protein [Gammaproteobacteria bacterium]